MILRPAQIRVALQMYRPALAIVVVLWRLQVLEVGRRTVRPQQHRRNQDSVWSGTWPLIESYSVTQGCKHYEYTNTDTRWRSTQRWLYCVNGPWWIQIVTFVVSRTVSVSRRRSTLNLLHVVAMHDYTPASFHNASGSSSLSLRSFPYMRYLYSAYSLGLPFWCNIVCRLNFWLTREREFRIIL